MKTGRRLIENVDRLSRVSLGEFRGQLDPLRLAAGKFRRRLAEPDIGQSDIVERLDLSPDARDMLKK
jgi:hypothetical protein